MKLYVDLESLKLIEGPDLRSPVSSIRFKRGDAASLEVRFLADGVTATSIGDPDTLELQFGVKPRNRYDLDYLVWTSDWVIPAAAPAEQVYTCAPSFNTTELNAAMGVDSVNGNELAELILMAEITWREGAGMPTSTRSFLIVVENDVNRGTEGVPTDAEPPYPAPENIRLNAVMRDIGNVSGAVAFDPDDGEMQKLTMTGDTTLNLAGVTASDGFSVRLKVSSSAHSHNFILGTGIVIPSRSSVTGTRAIAAASWEIYRFEYNASLVAWELTTEIGAYSALA